MIINKVPMETSFKWWSSIKSLLKHSYLEVKWEVSLALGKRETWASTIPGDHYQETRLISDFLSLVSIEVENAFENLTLHSLGLWAWSAHIPPASGIHGNHLWHFLKYNENTIMFETLTILRENLTFLPRQQVDQRNCNSITGNQGIPDKKIVTDLCITSLGHCWYWCYDDDEDEELTKLTVS